MDRDTEVKPMSKVSPLVDSLRARLVGPACNEDGTYTVGACKPDALCLMAADAIEGLRHEIERLTDELRLCCELKREYQEQAAAVFTRAELFTRAQLDAEVAAERERCAMVADSFVWFEEENCSPEESDVFIARKIRAKDGA